ncbi:hypothetical protein KM043_005065 [Ampulex compressa]|nr:hypothetical protein KM043_005065 [Ampulex compressa]
MPSAATLGISKFTRPEIAALAKVIVVGGIINPGIEWNRKWDGLIPPKIHSWQDSFFDPLGTTMAAGSSVLEHHPPPLCDSPDKWALLRRAGNAAELTAS